MGALRVVVVDDHQVVLDGLEAMLAAHGDRMVIVGSTTDPEEATRLVEELHPDLVLTDIRLQGSSGLDLCRDLSERFAELKVVIFTVYDDEQYLFQALRVGASGFLLKRTTAPQLIDHLVRVMAGEVAIDPSIAGRVAKTAAHLQSGEFWPGAHLGLTQRESEVLELMVRGITNRAIGQKLFISEETVKSHARSLYRKLDVDDRAQAVTVALREGVFH